MKQQLTAIAFAALTGISAAWAGEVAGVTTFSTGSPALASEVNNNFTALINAINDNNDRIAALEGAAADSSVAGHTYRLISLNTELASADDNSFANIASGSLDGTLAFDASNGSGSLTITGDNFYEVNVPSNQLQDNSDTGLPVTDPFTYVESGGVVDVTFDDPDGPFTVTFTASNDGSMIVARVVEPVGPTDFDGGATGTKGFIELLIGIRTSTPTP